MTPMWLPSPVTIPTGTALQYPTGPSGCDIIPCYHAIPRSPPLSCVFHTRAEGFLPSDIYRAVVFSPYATLGSPLPLLIELRTMTSRSDAEKSGTSAQQMRGPQMPRQPQSAMDTTSNEGTETPSTPPVAPKRLSYAQSLVLRPVGGLTFTNPDISVPDVFGPIVAPTAEAAKQVMKRTMDESTMTPAIPGRAVRARTVAETAEVKQAAQTLQAERAAIYAGRPSDAILLRAEELTAQTYALPDRKTTQVSFRIVTPSKGDHADRHCATKKLTTQLFAVPEQKTTFTAKSVAGYHWVWVSVAFRIHPGPEDVAAFIQAVTFARQTGILGSIDVNSLDPWLPKGANRKTLSAFLVYSMKELDNLSSLARFAFDDGTTDRAFFIQKPHSLGNRVVLDLHNAPVVLSELLEAVKAHLLTLMATTPNDEPADLRVAQLSFHAARGSRSGDEEVRSSSWRLSFTAKPGLAKDWVGLPDYMGVYKSRGLISCKESPLCGSCISWSHATEQCTWWRVLGFKRQVLEPKGYRPLVWTEIPTWSTRGEPLRAASAPKRGGGGRGGGRSD